MIFTHSLFSSSSQCLHALCRQPPTVHRRWITPSIRSKESNSSEEDLNFISRGDEPTNVPSVADVKLALGIEKKASSRPGVKKSGSKNLEFSGEEEFENPSLQKLQRVGKWLFDEGETVQDSLLVFLLLLLPIWIFAVLVAGGFIQLPFSVPFFLEK